GVLVRRCQSPVPGAVRQRRRPGGAGERHLRGGRADRGGPRSGRGAAGAELPGARARRPVLGRLPQALPGAPGRVRGGAAGGRRGAARMNGRPVSELSVYLDFRARPGEPPAAADYDDGVQLVQAAERLGFAHVWTTEQHGVDDGYLPAQLPMLAALARETSTIRLGTALILLPLAHPRRILEEACVVDALSHGRLPLGLGAGNYPNEFRIFGADMRGRRRAMDEGVAFIRAGLSGGVLPDGSPVNVPPVQRPIP